MAKNARAKEHPPIVRPWVPQRSNMLPRFRWRTMTKCLPDIWKFPLELIATPILHSVRYFTMQCFFLWQQLLWVWIYQQNDDVVCMYFEMLYKVVGIPNDKNGSIKKIKWIKHPTLWLLVLIRPRCIQFAMQFIIIVQAVSGSGETISDWAN